MHENGPAVRCPECNHKAPGHATFCRAGIDVSRPPTHEEVMWDSTRPVTSAARLRDVELPGRADADIAPTDHRPTHERYYPLDRPLPAVLEEPAYSIYDDPEQPARDAAHVNLGINPKDIVGASKTPLGLLPWTALVQVAGVFAVGAGKYGAYNWRTQGQPVQHVTYVEAAFRHLAAYMDGQTIDPETGCNHLAHAACGLLILLDASAVGNSIDNRPTPGVAAEIMAANLRK